MSTHATIGIDNGDGMVTSVYLHSDGFPAHAGRTLVEHYATAGKVRALLGYGDISILGASMDCYQMGSLSKEATGSVFYRRDRGETDVDALTTPIATWNTELGSYSYLFQNGRWRAWNAALVELDLAKSIAQGMAIVLESSERPNIDRLAALTGKLDTLLKAPEPGLFTWHEALERAMRALYDELRTYEWLEARR